MRGPFPDFGSVLPESSGWTAFSVDPDFFEQPLRLANPSARMKAKNTLFILEVLI